jgi:uncharacterized protein
MAAGATVDSRDPDGRTPLINAVGRGESTTVADLIKRGAAVNAADRRGWTALHMAAESHRVELARVLLDAGAAIESEDAHGNTPLWRAVFVSKGRGEMITFLLARGADRNHSNRHGVSPQSLAETIATSDVAQFFRSDREK